MIIGISPRFWYADTTRYRWSIRLRFWLAPGNMLWLNRQPRFAEIMIGRCVSLCRSDRGGRP